MRQRATRLTRHNRAAALGRRHLTASGSFRLTHQRCRRWARVSRRSTRPWPCAQCPTDVTPRAAVHTPTLPPLARRCGRRALSGPTRTGRLDPLTPVQSPRKRVSGTAPAPPPATRSPVGSSGACSTAHHPGAANVSGKSRRTTAIGHPDVTTRWSASRYGPLHIPQMTGASPCDAANGPAPSGPHRPTPTHTVSSRARSAAFPGCRHRPAGAGAESAYGPNHLAQAPSRSTPRALPSRAAQSPSFGRWRRPATGCPLNWPECSSTGTPAAATRSVDIDDDVALSAVAAETGRRHHGVGGAHRLVALGDAAGYVDLVVLRWPRPQATEPTLAAHGLPNPAPWAPACSSSSYASPRHNEFHT